MGEEKSQSRWNLKEWTDYDLYQKGAAVRLICKERMMPESTDEAVYEELWNIYWEIRDEERRREERAERLRLCQCTTLAPSDGPADDLGREWSLLLFPETEKSPPPPK